MTAPADGAPAGGERFDGHTPGPWEAAGGVAPGCVYGNGQRGRRLICDCDPDGDADKREIAQNAANARLIAQAPALAAEVERLRAERDAEKARADANGRAAEGFIAERDALKAEIEDTRSRWFKLSAESATLRAESDALTGALGFYANPETYEDRIVRPPAIPGVQRVPDSYFQERASNRDKGERARAALARRAQRKNITNNPKETNE